jgi:excisionase family DNA binding protein
MRCDEWHSLDMPTEDVNITTREVALIARVDPSTVRRWIERGALKPSMTTPGGQYRFNRSDIDALLTPAKGDAA